VDYRLAGVHVIAKDVSASFVFMDLTAVYATVAAAFIFLMLPARLMQLVVDNLLGTLSKVYD